MRSVFTVLMIMMLISVANARIEEHQFDNAEQEQRYHFLIDELRCLVCQNQNLADSNAELAQDLREQVYLMIKNGDTNENIINFMVSRYGDFVLYRPPLKPTTYMLWVGPFIILLIALIVVVQFIRKRQQSKPADINQSDRDKIKKMLDDDEDEKK
jgi:cytochrome c-type biogenesis protein CcmH